MRALCNFDSGLTSVGRQSGAEEMNPGVRTEATVSTRFAAASPTDTFGQDALRVGPSVARVGSSAERPERR
ncbi:hypothetical protein CP973_22575 [Streptomyces albofaciens JCM 4342]|nr:hypothetical protein CP973_22575 [Streptomyces albofaciens JCM 4342]